MAYEYKSPEELEQLLDGGGLDPKTKTRREKVLKDFGENLASRGKNLDEIINDKDELQVFFFKKSIILFAKAVFLAALAVFF